MKSLYDQFMERFNHFRGDKFEVIYVDGYTDTLKHIYGGVNELFNILVDDTRAIESIEEL